jgi:hypothetical protein
MAGDGDGLGLGIREAKHATLRAAGQDFFLAKDRAAR